MLKRYGFIFGILLLFIYNVFADQGGNDSFGYMWTDTEGTTNIDYEWIDIKHTTMLIGPAVSDQVVGVSLPFDFEFYGHKRDSLYICANGWVSFKYPGIGGWPTNDTIPSGSGPDSMIAVFWDDLNSAGGNNGGVYYNTMGSEPNRKFIVQWDLDHIGFNDKITFELILFEHSNLIKLQYYLIESSYNGGGSATIGIKADTSTGIEYSYNQINAVSAYTAILFHNRALGDTALASISPASVQAGAFPTFDYRIYDIETSGSTGLGKTDRFAIGNPFASSPTVTSIKINNYNAYIQNSSDKPTEAGYATWQYDAVNDSLIIQTSIFDVIDSAKVTFMQTMPETVSEGNEYKSSYDAVLDSSGRQPSIDDGWSVDVVGSSVAYYDFEPAGHQTAQAGDSISFIIRARDEFGNAVINSDSVIFSAAGSSSAWFVPNDRLQFNNSDSLIVTVTDTVTGSFTVNVVKKDASGITGQSGSITYNPADGHHFVIISSVDSITVSTDRLLQAALEDCFSNRLADSLVTFSRFHGNGYFSELNNFDTTVTTNSNGIGEALYTASDSTGYGVDSIQISFGSIADTITLPLKPASVSYYTFSPAGATTVSAGDSISFVIKSWDEFGNAVINSDSVIFSAAGSGSAWFVPNDRLQFNNSDSLIVTVTDTVTGSFTVNVVKKDASGITGQSGLITYNPADGHHFVIISSVDSITVSTDRLLQAALEDCFSNRLADSLITFSRFHGNGYFSELSNFDTTVTTNSNGIGEALYTASDSTGYGVDSIQISFGSVADTIALPLKPASVSYYTFSPSGDQTAQAGDSVSFVIRARDEFGNAVINSDSVIFSAAGSGSAWFVPNDRLQFNNSDSLVVTVTDTVTGSFTVNVVKKDASGITGQSGLITYNPADGHHFVIVSSVDSITVSTDRLLQAALEDCFSNRIADSLVTFSRFHGNGYFSELNNFDTTVTTNSSGIGEALYTASDSTGYGIDSIQISFGSVADTIALPLKPASVSYYTFSPSGDQTAQAGDSISFIIRARDEFGNAVINSDSVIFNASGSGSAWFVPNDRLQFNNSDSLIVTVTDTVTGSFTVNVVKKDAPGITGQSGLITYNPADGHHFVIISSVDSITVSTDRLLQAALEDCFSNRLADSLITFSRFHGNGYFSELNNFDTTVTTNSSGIGEALYTASDSIGYGADSIVVNFNTVLDTIALPLKHASVSYYTFSPSGDTTMSAGDSIEFTLTAYDQHGNEAPNNDLVNLSAIGSSTAGFSSNPVGFAGGSSLTFEVSDTSVGSFTIKAENSVNSAVNGQSDLITIEPAALDYVLIRTAQDNGGIVFGDSIFSTDDIVYFYSAGYDQFGNYRSDVSVTWSSIGDLESINATGDKFAFNPTLAGVTGRIVATHSDPLVTPDTTGDITVTTGALAELRIQINDSDGGRQLADSVITADENLILFSVGYDADGNYLGRVAADWDSSGVVDDVTPANPTDSVFFNPVLKGSGAIKAAANSDNSIYDESGLITVNPGAITYVIIRSAPDGGGEEIGRDTVTVGETLNLYSAGYDSDHNFNANANVDWHVSVGLTGLGDSLNTYSTTLMPTSDDSGYVYTANSNFWTNDSTGTIVVQSGSLASIRIQTAPGDGGAELTSYTGAAGDSLELYAAGYDGGENYLGLQDVLWSVEGDTIGAFKNSVSDTNQNVFYFYVVNSAQLKISEDGLNDYSGIIKVDPGAAHTLTRHSIDTVTARVNEYISDSLSVRITDAYGNVVPNVEVKWHTPNNGALNPETDQTDIQGISRSKWRVMSNTGLDSAYAGAAVIPDSVIFFANVLCSSADSLVYISGSGQTDTVNLNLDAPLVVQVLDSLDNPVKDVSITFSVNTYPSGGDDYTLTPVSTITDAGGFAQTTFKLGSKAGVYTIHAYNSELTNSPVTFTATAVNAAPDSILIYSGDQQTGTVGAVLGQPVRVKVVDAFSNPLQNVGVRWMPSADGSVSAPNDSSYTDVNGIASTNWTLRTNSGNDTLSVQSGALTPAMFTAAANAAAADTILAYYGNNRTTIAGGTQLIRAQAQDQYGNVVSNATVTFLPASRVSNQTDITDADGLAQSVYTSVSNQDSSLAKAYITGVSDTAFFNIYGIRYVSNSLDPNTVMPGDTITFYTQVSNPGQDAVPLDTSASYLSFSDGSYTTTAKLDSPLTLPATANAIKLKYKAAVIDSGFAGGNYTPEMQFTGRNDYSNLNGVLTTDPGELSIEPLIIVSVTVQDPASKLVPRGGTINQIHMRVSNLGNYTIENLNPTLTFDPEEGFIVTPQAGNPTSILAGNEDDFYFSVDVPASANDSVVTVDGYIEGTSAVDGNFVNQQSANQTDQFTITIAAVLSYVDFNPKIVSVNQITAFTVDVSNTGDYDVLLNSDSTRIVFGGQVFYLDENQTAAPNVTTALEFFADTVELAAGLNYEGIIYLDGTENSSPMKDTLYTADNNDSLEVQGAAIILIDSVIASANNISRGVDTLITVVVSNTGQADLQIDSLIITPYGEPNSITPALPFILTGGAGRQFEVVITIPADADTGLIALDARAVGTDQNSGYAIEDNGADVTDNWNVFTPTDIIVTAITSTDTLVTPGQSGIPVNITIKNNGGSPAVINSIALIEKIGLYNHNFPPLPINLAGHADTTIVDNVDVLSNSATGEDTLYARINYTNEYSGGNTVYNSGEYLSWTIAGNAVIEIVSVQAEKTKVSQGQNNVNVQARIKNTGDSEATINTLGLVFHNGTSGNYSIGAISPAIPASIPAGLDQIFHIPVSIQAGAQTGPDTMYVTLNITETVGGSTYNVSDPTVNDQWTVQIRPLVTIDSVRINPEQASAGQQNLTGSVYLSNASGQYRAEAQVDTVALNFLLGAQNENDEFNITRQLTPTLPLILQPGSNNRFDFDVDINTDAPAGSYTADGYAESQDLNDGLANVHNGSADQGILDVQTAADLQVNSVWVVPDTVSQGQTGVIVHVDFENSSGSTGAVAVITQTDLTFTPGLNFNPVLTSHNTPFNLSGGQRDTLIYSININTTTYSDWVDVEASISGYDSNSDQTISDDSLETNAFYIQEPADVFWVEGSTNPSSATSDTTIQFRLQVVNRGEAKVELDSNLTTLDLEGTAYSIQLAGKSPNVITVLPDTTELIFRETFITGIPEDEYQLILNINGLSNNSNYSKFVDAGVFAFGDSLISITSIEIVGTNQAAQGDTGIHVIMKISNSGIPLPIDAGLDETTLLFKEPGTGSSRDGFILNLQRTDGLDTLRTNPNNQLEFKFDISDNFPLNITEIYGQISLDNNNIIKGSSTFAEMTVQSAANVSYLEGSLSPDTVIAREIVSFTAAFYDSGTADLTLDPDSTYLEILNSMIDPIYLAGKYTIGGLDTAILSYNSVTIDAALEAGFYDVKWRIKGETAFNQPYENEGIINNGLRVLSAARLIFSNITITPDVVRQGETNIPITYLVQNTGESDALISGIDYIFTKGGNDVSDQWLVSGGSSFFPDTLPAGAFKSYPVSFTLSSTADTGYIRPEPVVSYHDFRTAHLTDISHIIEAADSVLVICPARLNIDSLIIVKDSLAPNAPFVNIDVPFNLKVIVLNNGADGIKAVHLSLFEDENFIDNIEINNVEPFSTKESVYLHNGISMVKDVIFKAKIDSAIDLADLKVALDQAQDNIEIVFAQQPSQLSVSAEITAPQGAKDHIVSIGQIFTVRANVDQTGSSPYDNGSLVMRLPVNYQFVSDDTIKTFNADTNFAEWEIRPVDLTPEGQFDSLLVLMLDIPTDQNSGIEVGIGVGEYEVHTQVCEAGDIQTQLSISSPVGACDSIISTSQEFVLHNVFQFNAAIVDTGRTAKIILPEGFSVKDSSIITLAGGDTSASIDWRVIAPSEANAIDDTIYVLVSGYDDNSDETVQAISNKIPFKVVKQSNISLFIGIVEPVGALGDTVSLGQEFKLRAIIKNKEDASPAIGNGLVSIDLGEGDTFTLIEKGEVSDNVQKSFVLEEPVYWWIKVSESSQNIDLSVRPESQGLIKQSKKTPGKPGIMDNEVLYNNKEKKLNLKTLLNQILKSQEESLAKNCEIAVWMDSVPNDINTNLPPFFTHNDTVHKIIYVEDKASLEIDTENTTDLDTLSTGQTFYYTVTGIFSGNVEEAYAFIVLPDEFNQTLAKSLLDESTNQAVWRITIPDDYQGDGLDTISTFLIGKDAYSGENTDTSLVVQDIIRIEQKPKLALGELSFSPESVFNSKLISRGQEIELIVTPDYFEQSSDLDYAAITGTGTVALDPTIVEVDSFTLLDGGTLEKSFSELGTPLVWKLKAPQKDRTVNLKLKFNRRPTDKNSGLPVDIDQTTGTVSIALRVQQKQITVCMLNNLISDTLFSIGDNNAALLAFSVSNEGYDDSLNIHAVKLAFHTGTEAPSDYNLLNSLALTNMLKSIRVVKYSESGLSKFTSGADLYDFVDYQISDTTNNPFWITFTEKDVLPPKTSDTLVVLAEFNSKPVNRSFHTVLRNMNVYDVDPSIPLTIMDENGVKINESNEFVSGLFTIISSNPKEAFGNYPNPFGRNEDKTTITFYLQNQSDVEIRIFTLLGELVWTKKLTGLNAGHYKSVKWNGRNDRGHVVLNGVYLCYIDIIPRNGGSKKRYVTKIAYIK